MRVPSRLELRLPPERFQELASMDALRDLEYFFNDELMKDLAADNMRTFGDHAVHVTVAVDTTLQPDEIYAAVLAPESGGAGRSSAAAGSGGGAPDATRALGEEPEGPSTTALDADVRSMAMGYRIVITGPAGFYMSEQLSGEHWIIGRRGSSGRPLPTGYRKLDMEVRETISREQVQVDLSGDTMRIERIGKAPVGPSMRESLAEGETKVLPVGSPFYIEDYEVVISR
jgi:hypothetical protein